MTKNALTKEFNEYLKDHPEIDYLSFNELETVDGDGDGEIAFCEWIEVSCLPGANEGYYVHFRTVSPGSPGRLFAFGKCYEIDAGLACVNHFTRFFAEAVPPERRYVILPKFTAKQG